MESATSLQIGSSFDKSVQKAGASRLDHNKMEAAGALRVSKPQTYSSPSAYQSQKQSSIF